MAHRKIKAGPLSDYPDTDIEDRDNPEWLAEDFARAKSARNVLATEVFAALTGHDADAAWSFVIYRDSDAAYRWLLRSPNGKIVAHSGDVYRSRSEAAGAIDALRLADTKSAQVRDA